MIRLEAPGVEADGDVVGEHIVAGEIEIDQAGQLVAEEEDVVGKQIGMDDALRQIARPGFFQNERVRSRRSHFRPGCTPSASPAAHLEQRPPARDRQRVRARVRENPRRPDAAAPAPRRPRRNASRPARRIHMPSRKVTIAAGRPASLPSVSPSRSCTGCGQMMPRAARCSIRPRKNGRSPAATRFS